MISNCLGNNKCGQVFNITCMAGTLICLSSPLQLSDVRSSLHGSVRTAGFCLLSHCMSATCSISPLSFILEHLTVEILSPGKQTCEH